LKYNILGVTLARGGSKAIKNKNIITINGYPLIYYTIKEAKKSKYLTNYVVSTDSKTIKNLSNKYKAETPFLRPKKYSNDNSSSASALKHALIESERFYKKKFDYVVELMNTNPLKTVQDIDKVIEILIKRKADSVIAVNQLFDQHPARIKKIYKGRLRDFSVKERPESRRQDLKPLAFIRSGSIYAMSRKFVIQQKRYISDVSVPYIMKPKNVINIDTLEDLILAKVKLNEK